MAALTTSTMCSPPPQAPQMEGAAGGTPFSKNNTKTTSRHVRRGSSPSTSPVRWYAHVLHLPGANPAAVNNTSWLGLSVAPATERCYELDHTGEGPAGQHLCIRLPAGLSCGRVAVKRFLTQLNARTGSRLSRYQSLTPVCTAAPGTDER